MNNKEVLTLWLYTTNPKEDKRQFENFILTGKKKTEEKRIILGQKN